jgi:hypothetical protein
MRLVDDEDVENGSEDKAVERTLEYLAKYTHSEPTDSDIVRAINDTVFLKRCVGLLHRHACACGVFGVRYSTGC